MIRGSLVVALLACFSGAGFAAEVRPNTKSSVAATQTPAMPDSKQLERDLQRLSWKQFRWVVESVPKLKAGVDAYGPMGWKYVQSRYATYPWKGSIDRLEAGDKLQLVELIRRARKIR